MSMLILQQMSVTFANRVIKVITELILICYFINWGTCQNTKYQAWDFKESTQYCSKRVDLYLLVKVVVIKCFQFTTKSLLQQTRGGNLVFYMRNVVTISNCHIKQHNVMIMRIFLGFLERLCKVDCWNLLRRWISLILVALFKHR